MKKDSTKIKTKLLNEAYNEFLSLYEQYQNNLQIGCVFEERLAEKQYKLDVYNSVNNIIKWFISNYPTQYIGRIEAFKNRQYYLVVSDFDNNSFVCYKWSKNQMYNSHHDTKLYQSDLQNKNILNEKHYIVNVPDYDF